uniref:Uncharacterized protein n=1 Tax=Oryza barthii TaxID=65489 RepID=A0A0D3H2I5_9ORYZ
MEEELQGWETPRREVHAAMPGAAEEEAGGAAGAGEGAAGAAQGQLGTPLRPSPIRTPLPTHEEKEGEIEKGGDGRRKKG